jgi:hypothetical protein
MLKVLENLDSVLGCVDALEHLVELGGFLILQFNEATEALADAEQLVLGCLEIAA